jgi:hypothetical protein
MASVVIVLGTVVTVIGTVVTLVVVVKCTACGLIVRVATLYTVWRFCDSAEPILVFAIVTTALKFTCVEGVVGSLSVCVADECTCENPCESVELVFVFANAPVAALAG